MATSQSIQAFPQHQKVGPCFTRPAYRDGRRKTAVKVFTVATESLYLLIFGVPSLNLEHQLRERCRQYGLLVQLDKLTDYPEKERFTDVFLAKFNSVQTARRAKRALDDSSFYGGSLHVCYAPEYETVAECRIKLHTCRRNNARLARKAEHEYSQRLLGSSKSLPDLPLTEAQPSCSVPDPISSGLTSKPPDLKNTRVPAAFGIGAAQTISSLMGDALDDARRFWLERGLNLIPNDQAPLPISPVPESNCSSAFTQQQGLVLSCTGPNGKPLPLPVLQALSWQPYCPPSCEPKSRNSSSSQPLKSRNNSIPAQSISVNSPFMPRCIRMKSSANKLATTDTPIRASVSADMPTQSSPEAISVGELKRLAFTLGPEQGPSMPEASSQSLLVNKRKGSCVKRIVFHNRSAKRRRDANSESNTQNLM